MPAASSLSPLPQQNAPVLREEGGNVFSLLWRTYLSGLDRMFRTAQFGPLVSAANDAAAAAAGVPINGFYRNGSIVQIRVT